MACLGSTCVPLGSKQQCPNFRGQNPPKLPKIGPNKHLAAKSAKNSHIGLRQKYSHQIWNTDWIQGALSIKAKIWSKGQRLKLETWNLAYRMIARCPILENENLGQKGSLEGHVTILGNLWTPSASRERLILQTSNLARRMITGCIIAKKMKYGFKMGRHGVTWPFWGILGAPPYLGNR